MRWRIILVSSLLLNVLLAAGWFLAGRAWQSRYTRAAISLSEASTAVPLTKTNFVVRKQFFSWQEVESDDYVAFIANLRDIGCPEQTIHDIIIADVNALYARRRATEIVTPEQQWWRTEPDSNVVAAASARLREMEQDRRTLLTGLLGAGWESGDQLSLPRPTRAGVPLDGAILGMLSQDVKAAVQEISNLGADRAQAYQEAQRAAGKPVDPVELARLRQQTRAELAGVLTPTQLEEYLLRYSQNATTLRTELGQLKYFGATPEEFRQIFRATDSIDGQLQLLAGATDAASVQQRLALMAQRENSLRLALGQERYTQYRLLHDPVYQDAYAAAQSAGSTESAGTLYEINKLAADEQAWIKANTNLTAQQRAIESKRIELEQMKAVAQSLGQELPPEPAAATQTPTRPQPTSTHVLKGLEDLSVLARLYGVDPRLIRAANPTVDFNRLRPGDNLSIPLNFPPGTPGISIERGGQQGQTPVPPPLPPRS